MVYNMSDVFNDLDVLEQKCPKCGIILDFGSNTEYDEKHDTHICL